MSDIKTKLHRKLNIPTDFESAKLLEDDIFGAEGYQVKRQGMRTSYNRMGKNPHIEWYSDLGHSLDKYDTIYNHIEGLVKKYIGRSYNDAYSEVASRGLLDEQYYRYGFGTGKDIWKQLFESKFGNFEVKDGIIYRIKPKAPRTKDLIVHNWREEPVYIVREDYWKAARFVLLPILGWQAYYSYINKQIISEEAFNRLINHLNTYAPELPEKLINIYKSNNINNIIIPWYPDPKDYPKDCISRLLFERSIIESTTVYKYNSKEYWKIRKQQQLAKKRAIRQRRNPDRSEYDKTLKERKNGFKLIG